jgi:hypothetical protein
LPSNSRFNGEKWEDGEQHYEEIEIVCQKLENGPVAYDNPWK